MVVVRMTVRVDGYETGAEANGDGYCKDDDHKGHKGFGSWFERFHDFKFYIGRVGVKRV